MCTNVDFFTVIDSALLHVEMLLKFGCWFWNWMNVRELCIDQDLAGDNGKTNN